MSERDGLDVKFDRNVAIEPSNPGTVLPSNIAQPVTAPTGLAALANAWLNWMRW